MLVLVGQLALLVEQIKAYDQEIHRFFDLHPDSSLFCSLPGAGNAWHPGSWRNGVMTGTICRG